MNDSVDITEKRIKTQVRKILDGVAVVYDKGTPKPEFWPIFEREEKNLDTKLSKRPIGLMEIETACAIFRSHVIKAIS